MVLPKTAIINDRNNLEIGGLDTIALVEKYGTPLFVYDEADIRDKCAQYIDNFRSPDLETDVIYAGKAFLSLALCKIIDEAGLCLDVSSGGELFIAQRAGFSMSKVYMHGNNKTESELSEALAAGIGRIVVDSFDEIELLDGLASARGVRQKILLRMTPGIKPSTHSYIQTGQIDSKFGFGLASGDAIKAVSEAIDKTGLELMGFHVHIGSQIFSLHSFEKAIEVILEFAKKAVDDTGIDIDELNLGGGLGIKYAAADEPSTIEDYCAALLNRVAAELRRLNLTVKKVMIEPGRSIVGNAGVTLYKIGTIKRLPGIRTYVSVDGGMSDNLRPMLYDSVYEGIVANKAGSQAEEEVTIAGKHCESGDILIDNIKLPLLEIGDILCTPATGAYGYILANNYNRQPRPAVIMVADGKARTIIRRESYEDLVRLEE